MLSSIWALLIKPGDQYSSEESLQGGIFQNGENAQVVHGNKKKGVGECTYGWAHVMTGSNETD